MHTLSKVSSAAAAAATALLPTLALAQSTTTPGVPTTGVGGDAMLNLAILGVTGVLAVWGFIYVARELKNTH